MRQPPPLRVRRRAANPLRRVACAQCNRTSPLEQFPMWEPKRIARHLPRSRGEIVKKDYTVVKGGGVFSDMDVGDRPARRIETQASCAIDIWRQRLGLPLRLHRCFVERTLTIMSFTCVTRSLDFEAHQREVVFPSPLCYQSTTIRSNMQIVFAA